MGSYKLLHVNLYEFNLQFVFLPTYSHRKNALKFFILLSITLSDRIKADRHYAERWHMESSNRYTTYTKKKITRGLLIVEEAN